MSSAAEHSVQTLLVLDGTFGEGCVALLHLGGDSVTKCVSAPAETPHQPLVARAAALLPDAAARGQLAAVLIGVGPGSYTGLRAAASLAAGVAAALQIPVIQVPSDHALVLARDASGQSGSVVLPLGTREVLVVDDVASGGTMSGGTMSGGAVSCVALRSDAPIGADLARLAPHLPEALVSAGVETIAALRATGGRGSFDEGANEILLRYPAPPRGAERGGAQ
jgi:tRNA threonylcarbamoyladenosine biosynthesis protein TsaB